MTLLEIYLNSKTANQRVLDEVGNCYFHLPNIEIGAEEEAYVSVSNAVIPFSLVFSVIFNKQQIKHHLCLSIDYTS
jgi:hypothetical protein